MKQFAKKLMTTAVMGSALMSSAAFAEQKIGVVNVEGIFAQMPQAQAIQQAIAEEFKDRVQEVETLKGDIEYQINKRQREAATMSEAQIKELDETILKMRQDYAAKAQPLQQEVQQRQAAERNKLLGLIDQAIQAEAAAGDFDLVLSGQAAVYAKPEVNLSQKVLDRVSKAN